MTRLNHRVNFDFNLSDNKVAERIRGKRKVKICERKNPLSTMAQNTQRMEMEYLINV